MTIYDPYFQLVVAHFAPVRIESLLSLAFCLTGSCGDTCGPAPSCCCHTCQQPGKLWTSMDSIVDAIGWVRLPQVTTPQTVYREVPPKMPNGKVGCRFERFSHRQVRPRPSAPAVATRLSCASPKSPRCQFAKLQRLLRQWCNIV